MLLFIAVLNYTPLEYVIWDKYLDGWIQGFRRQLQRLIRTSAFQNGILITVTA